MKIHARRLLREELPESTVERLAAGSWFASAGFAGLWRTIGGTPVVWVMERDGRFAGVMPGVEFGHGPLALFCSMPDGCYGGLLLEPEAESERAAIATALFDALSERRYRGTHVFDFYHTLPQHPGFTARACEATLIEIGGAEWSPPDRKLVAQARKATREGIRVEPFEWTRHRERLLRLVEITAARHRVEPRYPPAFYQALSELATRDPRVVWRWCEHDGAPAASHIYVRERGMLLAWHTYFDRRFSFLKPNPYIRLTLCRTLAPAGLTCMNLGSTPATAPGLAAYKMRWGGARVTYPRYERTRGLHADLLMAALAGWRRDNGNGAANGHGSASPD